MIAQTRDFSRAKLTKLLQEHYHLHTKTIAPLKGWYDKNWHVRTVEDTEFVLKATRTTSNEELECQNRAMAHLARKGIPVPIPRRTTSGDEIVSTEGALLRLLSYLPDKVVDKEDCTPALLRNVGALVANVGLGLADFDHPGAHRRLRWDLQQFGDAAGRLAAIKDPERRGAVEAVVDHFRRRVAPRLARLPSGVIHNDIHQWNITHRGTAITGLFDFGDIVASQLVNDLAITLATFLYEEEEAMTFSKRILGGYCSVRPLSREEADLLPDLMLVRLAMIYAHSCADAAEQQGNSYIDEHIAYSWQTFAWFKDLEREKILELLYPRKKKRTL